MSIANLPLSPQEVGHRGKDLYENCLRQKVEEGNVGRVVAIDVITGRYAVGDDGIAAKANLRPATGSQIFLIRIGARAYFERSGRRAPATES